MARNYIGDVDRINYTNTTGSAILSGAPVFPEGYAAGVALVGISAGASGPVQTRGTVRWTKQPALAIAQGARCFWDAANSRVTTSSGAFLGLAATAAAAGDAEVIVALNEGNASSALTAPQVTALQVVVSGAGIFSGLPSDRLPRFRKALSRVLAGTGNAVMAFAGDSTTAGLSSQGTEKFSQAPSSVAAAILARSLCNTNLGSSFGDGTRASGTNARFTQFDSRFVLGGAWNTPGGFSTAGGSSFLNASDTATLAFTPVDPFDTIDIYSIVNTGYGTWTVNVDGGAALATVNDNNSPRVIKKTSVSCAAGTHTINIQRNGTGGAVVIIGIATRLSSKKCLEFWNLGSGSTRADQWASSAAGTIDMLPVLAGYAADLYWINVGINDWRTGLYTAAYDANLTTIVTACRAAGGDVILEKPVPSAATATAFTTAENIAQFYAAIDRVAEALGVPVFSRQARLTTYDEAFAAGFMMADLLHPNPEGYAALGRDQASALLKL